MSTKKSCVQWVERLTGCKTCFQTDCSLRGEKLDNELIETNLQLGFNSDAGNVDMATERREARLQNPRLQDRYMREALRMIEEADFTYGC